MGYRCWKCRGEILPGGDEVWRDRYGDIVHWGNGVIHRDPAPYHPKCGEEFAATRPSTTDEELDAMLPSPKKPKVPPKGQLDLF